ncbi:aldose 1-epimerase family protein [Arthrobacter sp. S39]|uniref:aldose 1-epimerase family protein n=1 Tax=Arthrobacter sp. S39 TaxID=2509720 RepID=UPI00103815A9|nr:aldose 1-epimerase family protein [Arthrobacter sp. S39]TAP44117.1 galactose mutarotase [Arthrobacter sp. S39]
MSGTEHSIAFGPYSAIITARGGALRELQFQGRHLVVTFGPDGEIPDYRGVICAPWPNRLADGTYSYAGRSFGAALNEPERGTALHGLLTGVEWELRGHTADSVTLAGTVEAGQAYPAGLDVAVTYSLSADGLSATVLTRNTGTETAPYGVCPHPYLVAGSSPLDEWTLELPAREFLAVSAERLLPEGIQPVDGHEFDFRTPRRLGAVKIDHAFTGIVRGEGGLAAVRVLDPAGTGVELEWDANWPWVQVHTADKPAGKDRLGLAVEPMTCPPDAFNSGTDLAHLAPGESHEAGWTIRALS